MTTITRRGSYQSLSQSTRIFKWGVAVGVVAVLSSLFAARVFAVPFTDPMSLGFLFLSLTGSKYAQPLPGVLHVAYLGGLGLLCALGALTITPARALRAGTVLLAGLVAGGMNALAAAPPAAAGGGFTGLALLAPLGVVSTVAVAVFASLVVWLSHSIASRARN